MPTCKKITTHDSLENFKILDTNSWNITFLSMVIRYRNVSQMDKLKTSTTFGAKSFEHKIQVPAKKYDQ